MKREEYNILGREILDASIHVHKEMGPGLLESVYHQCLYNELDSRDIICKSEVFLPLHYKGKKLGKSFKIDILVEGEIIIELKAVEAVLPVHEAQIISYLKLANMKLGYLINFNTPLLKDGFKRFVNNF
jgi:GxxExxY protein